MLLFCLIVAIFCVEGTYFHNESSYGNGTYHLFREWNPIVRQVTFDFGVGVLAWSFFLLRVPRPYRNIRYALVGFFLSGLSVFLFFSGLPPAIK